MSRPPLILPALAVLLLLAAARLRADAAKAQDKDLDGEWEMTDAVKDGKTPQRPPEGVRPLYAVKDGVMTPLSVEGAKGGALKVDPSKDPKEVDATPLDGPQKGKAMLGIYEVKGDVLRLCFADPGIDRPTEFSSKEGSGRGLMTFQRVKKRLPSTANLPAADVSLVRFLPVPTGEQRRYLDALQDERAGLDEALGSVGYDARRPR